MSDKFMKKLEELLEEQQDEAEATDPTGETRDFLTDKETRDFLTDHGNYENSKRMEPHQALEVLKGLQRHPDIDPVKLIRDRAFNEMKLRFENGGSYPDWFRTVRSIANLHRVEGADKFDIRPETRPEPYEDEETESSPVVSSVNKDSLEESFKNLQEAFSALKVSLNEASAEEKQSYLKMLKELKDG